MDTDGPDGSQESGADGSRFTDLPEPNLVLTGFMGTGKSEVGRRLAAELGRDFVDTDSVIVDRFGEIAEIFVHGGEKRFRRIERIVAGELARRRGVVVATGGGMLLDPEVASLFQDSGRVYCLCAEPDTIVERVLGDPYGHRRPLLAGGDPAGRVRDMLSSRAERYAVFEQVTTDGRTIDAIANDILRRFVAVAPG